MAIDAAHLAYAERLAKDLDGKTETFSAGVVRRLLAEIKSQQERIATIREKLEAIVCTKDPDKGVVLLSYDGPTHYDPEIKGQVYDHEYFSPLGDALIELHELTK